VTPVHIGSAHPGRPRRFFFEYAQAAIIGMIFALFVRTYLFQMFKIPSASMEDTLLIGDHVLVNKFAMAPLALDIEREFLPFQDVHRGDVVIFRYPHDMQQDYVKRIIGLPGDTVRIVDQVVYIRPAGEKGFTALPEPYMVHKFPGEVPDNLMNFGPIEIPDGQYFAMGDNRDDSLDSREWGFVPRRNIVGRVLLVYWSFKGVSPDGTLALASGEESGLKRFGHALTAIFRYTRWERSGLIVR
jgi:signal peptidase I